MVDLKALVDGPFQLDRIALYFRRFNGMRDLPVRAKQPATVHLQAVRTPHQPKFNGEPKEPRHGPDDAGKVMRPRVWPPDPGRHLSGGMGTFPEPHQRL